MGKMQQKAGKSFEDELLVFLKERGFWATKLKTGVGGTAFDIIAVKNGAATAFECKTVAKGEALRYTRELKKKTDELDYYNQNGTNPLFLAVRFGDGAYLLGWQCAKSKLTESGYILKQDMQRMEEAFSNAD